MRRHLRQIGIAVLAVLMTLPSPARPCPFCMSSGQSLLQSVESSDVAFIGDLSDSKFIASTAPGSPDGETKAEITKLLKSHEALQNRKELTLPRFIPGAEKEKVPAMVLALVADGLIDPYKVSPVDSPELADYLSGALAVQGKTPADRVAYFFKYLDHADRTISQDAYTEFALAPYKDVLSAKKAFDAERIHGWLADPRTEGYRIGLYGLLLGICGRPEDKQAILDILTDPKKRPLSGVDGLMGGLVVLDPKEGVDFVVNAINSSDHDFNFRYAALRTVTRFILTDLPEIDRNMIFDRLKPAIQIKDISDLVTDEYRKAKIWTPTKEVLALFNDPKFNVNVIKRAVVRYALQCPDPEAVLFVAQLRKDDPQMVADVEDILRFEEASQIKATPAGDGKT